MTRSANHSTESKEGMLQKGWFGFLLALLLFPLITYSQVAKTSDCLILGPKPSLIIKFSNISSKRTRTLNHSFLNSLSSPKATFTAIKPMSGGAYILFFTPTSLTQPIRGCYDKREIEKLINELNHRQNVDYVAPNILMNTFKLKTFVPIIDPVQWDMLDPPGGIDLENAFAISTGNANAITAVIDTGITTNNSLTPNLLTGVTFNNNGDWSNGAAASCDSACATYDHGTHVAGTVSASGTLAYGETIFGVAPTSKIIPINVGTKSTDFFTCLLQGSAPPCLLLYTADYTNALNWLNGEDFAGLPSPPYVTAINMSFGGVSSCPAAVQEPIDGLLSKNISIAVASGNSNVDASFISPANCNGVMAIAATGPDGYGAFYSNYGDIISFAAPGGDSTGGMTDEIYSTIENSYGYKQGTSMASPHVAGLATLLYSIDPTLTPTLLTNLISTTTTAFPPGGPGNACTLAKPCGSGIIDANSAALATLSQAPILSAPDLELISSTPTQLTIAWSASSWAPARSTAIVYTVNINGGDLSTCQYISDTTCTISNLSPATTYAIYIKATDIRKIYGPATSAVSDFTTSGVTPPHLTTAIRNPLKTSEAFIYYDSLGNYQPNYFVINGISNVTLTLDTTRRRFAINNITNPRSIPNVSISATNGNITTQSNAVTIPSIL